MSLTTRPSESIRPFIIYCNNILILLVKFTDTSFFVKLGKLLSYAFTDKFMLQKAHLLFTSTSNNAVIWRMNENDVDAWQVKEKRAIERTPFSDDDDDVVGW